MIIVGPGQVRPARCAVCGEGFATTHAELPGDYWVLGPAHEVVCPTCKISTNVDPITRGKITVLLGDITEQRVDVIVNSCGPSLMGGGGVDGAIHAAAGPVLLDLCRRVRYLRGPLVSGEAVWTLAGNLHCGGVIHAQGPKWPCDPLELAHTYLAVLELAEKNYTESIALPSIATGGYGYPVEEAARVALGTVRGWCSEHRRPTDVRFVLFDLHTYFAYRRHLE